MEYIKSKQNKNIKNYVKLLNNKKYRDALSFYCFESDKIFLQAFEAKVEFHQLFVTEKFLKKIKLDENLRYAFESVECEKYIINDMIKEYIMDTKISHDIFCVCKKLDKKLSIDTIYNKKTLLFLHDVQNPVNIGKISRTADAFLVDGIILNSTCCDIYNSKVLRASMGSMFRTDIYFSDNIIETTDFLKSSGFFTYAAVVNDFNLSLLDAKFEDKVVIYLGNEGKGLPNEIVDLCDYKLNIDINPKTDSLNVSVAASIIMWEVFKQSRG